MDPTDRIALTLSRTQPWRRTGLHGGAPAGVEASLHRRREPWAASLAAFLRPVRPPTLYALDQEHVDLSGFGCRASACRDGVHRRELRRVDLCVAMIGCGSAG